MTSHQPKTEYGVWIRNSFREAAWAPLLVLAINLVAITVFESLAARIQLDVPMHYFGGLAMAYFIHRSSLNASLTGVIGPYHPLTHRLLVLTGTCTVAVFWEFGEFISDRTLGSLFQIDVQDTLVDLLLGMIGAGTFVLCHFFSRSTPALAQEPAPDR